MTEKKLSKVKKTLTPATCEELEALGADELKARVTAAHRAINEAREELEKNPAYREAKENLSALSEGMKDVKKRQLAVSDYCIHLLQENGE